MSAYSPASLSGSVPSAAAPAAPLIKRVLPGLWAALVWCVAALAPVLEYVLFPVRHVYLASYPRDGLASLAARVLLVLAFALVLVGSALLRRRTMWAFALVLAGTVVSTAAWRQNEIPPLQFLGVNAVLVYVVATRPRRAGFLAAAGALGVLAGYVVYRLWVGAGSGIAPEPSVALTVVIAWLVGDSVARSRAHTAASHARAAVQAVTAERLRIAREMHDTAAHSMGVIAFQAGAAARMVETRPASARESMRTVERVGRETLAGLRRTCGALREVEPAPAATEAERTLARALAGRAEGLADMARLVETTSAAGVRMEVRWRGRRRPLPAETDLAAFRIVQESVTNVVRHAGADSCEVHIDYAEDEVAIEVRDRGRGPGGGPVAGHGLAGMTERVHLLRGRLTAGPRPEGGFLVAARLPVPSAAAVGRKAEPEDGAG